jgi:molecular chaperone HscB
LLERRFIGLQGHLHPDRFAVKPARERALAEAQAVSLNEAYETLKDPLKRALYLLRLKGSDTAMEVERTNRDTALLMEVMERREALAGAGTRATIERLASETAAEAIQVLAGLSAAFAGDDLHGAERLVVRLRYLRKFLEEARARLVALEMA